MRERPAFGAALAVVVLVVGQLAAIAHGAATRHVICELHGEEIEAPRSEGAVDHCNRMHFIGVDGASGEHEDCAIARVLRQNTQAPRSAPTITVTTVIATAACPSPPRIVTFLDLVLIAPKTSPPV